MRGASRQNSNLDVAANFSLDFRDLQLGLRHRDWFAMHVRGPARERQLKTHCGHSKLV